MIGHFERGMTLVEILIAITLLSLLSTAVLVAMRLGFSTMDKTDTHLVHNRRVANTRRIIENEIAGFTYSIARFQPEPRTRIDVSFAEWTPREMRFVTAYSLEGAWRGRLQIAVLGIIPGADNRGVHVYGDVPTEIVRKIEELKERFRINMPKGRTNIDFATIDDIARRLGFTTQQRRPMFSYYNDFDYGS